MPVSWRIVRGVVFVESTGKPTFAEWRAAVDAFLADLDYRPGMSVVHDWREAQDVPSPIEIQRRAAYAAGRLSSHPTRWALVVRGVTSYGMARMAEALMGDSAVHVRMFRDPTAAETWARAPEA
jgi:hypothetical protein